MARLSRSITSNGRSGSPAQASQDTPGLRQEKEAVPHGSPAAPTISDDKAKQALLDDLDVFGRVCLRIRDKSGNLVPFEMNEAQRIVQQKLEEQRKERGWVRALILKGRQLGISTYTAARFYHRASTRRGVNVFILSHEQASADALFGIVDRYQANNPLAPHAGTANIKELIFDQLDSSYVVATAGSKATGRSRSLTLFHGSEVAMWNNASDHFAASVQAVPAVAGTEIILESTSSGASGEFYNRYQDAMAGRGDYIPIFLPWWLAPDYRRDPEPGFVLSSETTAEGEMSEQEYADTYKVPLSAMAWRRAKLWELRSPLLFKREYPATVQEAWTRPPDHEPFIDPLLAARARKRTTAGHGPLVLGVDPASMGGDRFSVAARRGLRVEWVRYRDKIDHLQGIAWLRTLIDELRPARVNIDAGNIGAAIVTGLKTLGPQYANIVRGVNFGATSETKTAKPKVPGPANRRAEMWTRMRDWLMQEEGVAIPDDDALEDDITAPRLKPRLNHDYVLEAKEEMRRRGERSPDLADAVALTFAFNEWIPNYHEPAPTVAFGNVDKRPEVSVDSYDHFPTGENAWMA